MRDWVKWRLSFFPERRADLSTGLVLIPFLASIQAASESQTSVQSAGLLGVSPSAGLPGFVPSAAADSAEVAGMSAKAAEEDIRMRHRAAATAAALSKNRVDNCLPEFITEPACH